MSNQGGQSQGGLCKQGGWHASHSQHHKRGRRKKESKKRNQGKRRKNKGRSLQVVGPGMLVYRRAQLSRKIWEHWTIRWGALDKRSSGQNCFVQCFVGQESMPRPRLASQRNKQSRRKEGKAKGKQARQKTGKGEEPKSKTAPRGSSLLAMAQTISLIFINSREQN